MPAFTGRSVPSSSCTSSWRRAALALLAAVALAGIAVEPAVAAPAGSRGEKLSDRGFRDEVLRSGVPVLVEFGAPWCMPCRRLEGALATVAGDFAGRVRIVELDEGSSRHQGRRYGVEALPTLILFTHGQPVERSTGALSAVEIEELLATLGPGFQQPVPAVAAAGTVAASAGSGA